MTFIHICKLPNTEIIWVSPAKGRIYYVCTTVVLDQYVHTLFAIRMCKVHSICSADSLDKADVQSGLCRSLDL